MRNEYPRPELKRDSYLCLNGEWAFDFDFADTLEAYYPHFNRFKAVTYNLPKKELSKKIQVPFCPESKLSGIEYTDYIGACWYQKMVDVSAFLGKRILLNFEAAFHTTDVFVFGKHVGKHLGGYTPFSFDITDFVQDGKADILIHCSGDARNLRQPSGKQEQLNYPYGCFYVRSTGIWATVWIEAVPEQYIRGVRITPDVDNGSVLIDADVVGTGDKTLEIACAYHGKKVGSACLKTSGVSTHVQTVVPLDEAHLWDLENPNLYDVDLTLRCGKNEDKVQTYFGLRKIELDQKGLKLNGKRVFQRLVLDQGYYPDGLYTAPDEKCFAKDIEMSKRVGFNGARLHEKVFERRFLYEADRLGYLVWGEYPSWGFDYSDEASLLYYLPEWLESVERDYNHPSIVGWCPFNENWDIFGKTQCNEMVRRVYLETKRLDKTRPVLDTSWNYHVQTDWYDVHDYTQDLEEFARRFEKFEDGKAFDSREKEQPQKYCGQPYFLSEYGGLKWPNDNKGWGYNNDGIKSEDDFVDKIEGFQKVIYANPRISACCYTQLYDVQQECNGLYYYDRRVKFEEKALDRLKEVMSKEAAYEKED